VIQEVSPDIVMIDAEKESVARSPEYVTAVLEGTNANAYVVYGEMKLPRLYGTVQPFFKYLAAPFVRDQYQPIEITETVPDSAMQGIIAMTGLVSRALRIPSGNSADDQAFNEAFQRFCQNNPDRLRQLLKRRGRVVVLVVNRLSMNFIESNIAKIEDADKDVNAELRHLGERNATSVEPGQTTPTSSEATTEASKPAEAIPSSADQQKTRDEFFKRFGTPKVDSAKVDSAPPNPNPEPGQRESPRSPEPGMDKEQRRKQITSAVFWTMVALFLFSPARIEAKRVDPEQRRDGHQQAVPMHMKKQSELSRSQGRPLRSPKDIHSDDLETMQMHQDDTRNPDHDHKED